MTNAVNIKGVHQLATDFISESDLPVLGYCCLNFSLIAADIYWTHQIYRVQSVTAGYAPFVCVIAALLMLVGLISSKKMPRLSINLHQSAAFLGLCLGVLGVWFHLEKFLERQSVSSLVYSAPFAAPLILCGIAVFVILMQAQWIASRTRRFLSLLLVSGFFAGNFVLALLDHSQNGFYHPAEWMPVFVSAFGCAVWFGWAFGEDIRLRKMIIYCGMAAGFTGLLGMWFHLKPVLIDGGMSETALARVPLTAPLLMVDAWIFGELVRLRFNQGFLKIK